MSLADLAAKPHLIKLLNHQDQLSLGLIQPTKTNSKPPTKNTSNAASTAKPIREPQGKPELQAHAEFLHWIKKTNASLPAQNQPILALHADPTKPSGILPGWPDFSLFWHSNFRPLFLEFKRNHKASLSPAQQLIHAYLNALGHNILTVTGSHHAITTTTNHFQLNALQQKPTPFIDS